MLRYTVLSCEFRLQLWQPRCLWLLQVIAVLDLAVRTKAAAPCLPDTQC